MRALSKPCFFPVGFDRCLPAPDAGDWEGLGGAPQPEAAREGGNGTSGSTSLRSHWGGPTSDSASLPAAAPSLPCGVQRVWGVLAPARTGARVSCAAGHLTTLRNRSGGGARVVADGATPAGRAACRASNWVTGRHASRTSPSRIGSPPPTASDVYSYSCGKVDRCRDPALPLPPPPPPAVPSTHGWAWFARSGRPRRHRPAIERVATQGCQIGVGG